MSKNTYFNGELIPSTSNFGRIGSSFAKNKEEAKAKFIENLNLISVINDTQKSEIIQTPSIVSVDVTPANKDTCSKYTISVPAEVTPRLFPKNTISSDNNINSSGLNDYNLDFEGGGRKRKHSSRKRRRCKTKRRKCKSKKSKRKR